MSHFIRCHFIRCHFIRCHFIRDQGIDLLKRRPFIVYCTRKRSPGM
ncbi:hypothetical protein J5X98_21115 [Leptothermofonsia sichuanensis E412]|nr:hypothetical protein [Leptothermofonsia sichuanensis]QZZ19789.1 hypothetical protein J5X98_21115 [Leptothermofonsia sichuanensis E412]